MKKMEYFPLPTLFLYRNYNRSENCKISRVKAKGKIFVCVPFWHGRISRLNRRTKDWRNREEREERFRFSAR